MGALVLAFGVYALIAASLAAFLVGVPLATPFLVIPRGRRERFTIVAAVVWAHVVLRAVLFVRPVVTGAATLPGTTGALYLCNHRSWLDPVLMIAYTRSQGLSKALVFWLPFIGFYGWLTGAVFFNRRSPAQRMRARDEVMRLLRGGHRIHVFPEGTRTRDGRLNEKVYLTLVKDCFAAGLPVVPCAVMHTERAIPTNRPGAVPFRTCRLDVGTPMWPKDHADAEAFAQACWAAVVERVARLEAEGEAASAAA